MSKKIIVYCSNFLVVFFIFFVLAATLKSSVVSIPYKTKFVVSTFMPEGWGFFTKSPRESQYTLYRMENNQWREVSFKNNSYRNLFGFSKLSRRVNLETMRLKSKIDQDTTNKSWHHIKRRHLFTVLKNGNYMLKQDKVIPWSFVNLKYKVDTKYHRIKLEN